MNKTLLTVAIILILWMIYHRNDDYKLNKKIEKVKKENVQTVVIPSTQVDAKRFNCGAMTPLDQIVWSYNNQPQALLAPDSPLFAN